MDYLRKRGWKKVEEQKQIENHLNRTIRTIRTWYERYEKVRMIIPK